MDSSFIEDFRNSVLQSYGEMKAISEEAASSKPGENQWSVKELLGHLLDSASNNHQRFVRLQISDEIEFPFYQQEDFVRVNHYQRQKWETLLEFWKLYNLHLIHLVENIDGSKLNNIWLTPSHERLTLGHIVEDYLRHLKTSLRGKLRICQVLTMHKFITTLFVVAFLCFGCIARGKVTQPPDTVNELLWWFPADTETLMVAKGPITITDKEPERFMDFMQRMTYVLMHEGKKSGLELKLKGQKILLSIEGCRKFRSPKSLGLPPYEGCHIYILDKEFAAVRNSIMQTLEVSAKEVLKIGEYKVLLFEEKLDEDIWKFYLVSPKEDTFLLATDLSFITEVLKRMKVKQGIRALPESLKEWKYVDTNAQYWAIRHYDINNATQDPTSPLTGIRAAANAPDKQAIGIVSMFDPGKAFIVRYLSSNKEAEKIQKDFWIQEFPSFKPSEIRVPESGIVEIKFLQDNQNAGTILLFMAAFGHAIFL